MSTAAATGPSLVKQVKVARAKGTPLIGITTPDPAATIEAIAAALPDTVPIIQWDSARGLTGYNDAGLAALAERLPEHARANPARATSKLDEAMTIAGSMPGGAIVFLHNAQRWLKPGQAPQFAQAVWNLRDTFKTDQRLAVLLGPGLDLTPELLQDVVILDEPLPGDEQLLRIVEEQHGTMLGLSDAVPELTDEVRHRAVDALRGLAAFPAEQLTAMSFSERGLNVSTLRERKYQMIEQTRGLGVDRGSDPFDQIGGLAQAKTFGRGLFSGPRPPRCIVRLDELEKMLGGAGTQGAGDTSGIAQDALGVILRTMEDEDWPGMIALGVPGSGKSLFSKALGATFDVLALSMDLGAMKGSLVGESQAAIRQAMKIVKAVAGSGGAFFIGCCNRLDAVPPELRRRFRMGVWWWGLPEPAERDAIWQINLKRYGLAEQPRPDDGVYTGADIRSVCDLAWRLDCSLIEASAYIVPVAKSSPDVIDQMEANADGKFLSASYQGVFRRNRASSQPARRAISA